MAVQIINEINKCVTFRFDSTTSSKIDFETTSS